MQKRNREKNRQNRKKCCFTCLCERHLERKFKTLIGISPKLFSKIIRFQEARQYAKAHPTDSLHSIAIACGYHDQSHMHKEFKQLGNIAPSDLFI